MSNENLNPSICLKCHNVPRLETASESFNEQPTVYDTVYQYVCYCKFTRYCIRVEEALAQWEKLNKKN